MYFQTKISSFLFKYKMIHKFFYKNSSFLPEIDRIVLNFGCKTNDCFRLATGALALQILAGGSARMTVSKKPHIYLTLKKGTPTGCKLIIKNSTKSLKFFKRLLGSILTRIKTFSGFNLKKNVHMKSFFMEMSDCFVFPEIESGFAFFGFLPKLDVRIVFKNSQNSNELKFMLLLIPVPLLFKRYAS